MRIPLISFGGKIGVVKPLNRKQKVKRDIKRRQQADSRRKNRPKKKK